MRFCRKYRSVAFAAAMFGAACTPAVNTETAQVKGPKGLPMWVIEDKDSTIYLTGTVHALPPGLEWKSEKLIKAVEKADELWVEVPMPGDQAKMMELYGPMIMQRMMTFNRPLSSLLDDQDEKLLAEAAVRAKLPEGAAAAFETMRPWAVTQLLGIGPLLASGYDANAGIDINIVRLAEEQKDTIKGFETFEQQMDILSAGTEEEQLEALRKTIRMPPEETDKMLKQSEAAFEAWANGDPKPAEDLFVEVAAQGDEMSGMKLDSILYDRNADWANQIEKLLAEDGVSFIAVGAGHLVGPKNVRELLAAKGIEAKPY